MRWGEMRIGDGRWNNGRDGGCELQSVQVLVRIRS